MTAQFTPGPWAYDYSVADGASYPAYMVLAAGNAYIASVVADDEMGVSRGVVEANARLIAAAPEMYEILRYLDEFDLGCDAPREFWSKVESALAKADGREP